jgi:DNA-binding GntR family transcriptional regulator
MRKLKSTEEISLSQKAYDFLREKIVNNKLKPGEPISESSIRNELGVSRTPIREALKLLEKENFVKVYPKRGAFITPISLGKIQEIYQIREIIEGEVARQVAVYISVEELCQIEKKLTFLKSSGDQDLEEAVLLGQELHRLILKTFGNETLTQFIEALRIDIFRGCGFVSGKSGNALKFLNQHLNIIDSLKKRDGEKAKILTVEHLQDARKSILT